MVGSHPHVRNPENNLIAELISLEWGRQHKRLPRVAKSLVSPVCVLYGALVVTSRTSYGALQVVVLLLLLLLLLLCHTVVKTP